MDIMKDNIFEKTREDRIKQKIQTKEDLSIVEGLDIFKETNEIDEGLQTLKKEEDIINKQDFEEDNQERDIILNNILEDLNKNVLINFKKQEEDSKQKAIEELLKIFNYPHSDNDNHIGTGISPFKSMLKPKKISMVGRVFYNSTDKDNNNNCENLINTNDKSNCINNNIGNIKH